MQKGYPKKRQKKNFFLQVLGYLKQPVNQLIVVYSSCCPCCDKGVVYSNVGNKGYLEIPGIIFGKFCKPKIFQNKIFFKDDHHRGYSGRL